MDGEHTDLAFCRRSIIGILGSDLPYGLDGSKVVVKNSCSSAFSLSFSHTNEMGTKLTNVQSITLVYMLNNHARKNNLSISAKMVMTLKKFQKQMTFF